MADANEDDTLEVEIPTGEEEPSETPEPEAPAGEEEEEVLVSFEGDEAPPASSEDGDSSVIRTLRAENRRHLAELKALKAAQQPLVPQQPDPGPKPTLASCDYDEEAFEAALDTWKADQAKAKQAEDDAAKAQQAQQEVWNKKLAEVDAQKAKLPKADYDQASEEVKSTFSELQQALVIRAAKNPAFLIYALGNSPQKLADLAKISDPVEFTAEVARQEGKLSVVTQRKAPEPERVVRGSAPLSSSADKHLERLEAAADRTGDRTEVVRYKKSLAAKAKS